jgi:hypothetical protein
MLAFPGFFDQDLGQESWQAVSICQPEVEGAESMLPATIQVHSHLGLPSLVEETPFSIFADVCGPCSRLTMMVTDPMTNEARRRRIRGCVETAGCLVCCADV